MSDPEDIQYQFQVTFNVTAHSVTDALRMLSPSLNTIRALNVKRETPEVELLAEVPAWSRTTSA